MGLQRGSSSGRDSILQHGWLETHAQTWHKSNIYILRGKYSLIAWYTTTTATPTTSDRTATDAMLQESKFPCINELGFLSLSITNGIGYNLILTNVNFQPNGFVFIAYSPHSDVDLLTYDHIKYTAEVQKLLWRVEKKQCLPVQSFQLTGYVLSVEKGCQHLNQIMILTSWGLYTPGVVCVQLPFINSKSTWKSVQVAQAHVPPSPHPQLTINTQCKAPHGY